MIRHDDFVKLSFCNLFWFWYLLCPPPPLFFQTLTSLHFSNKFTIW